MAWDNRDVEPRREWIEQLFGLLSILLWCLTTYYIVSKIPYSPDAPPKVAQYFIVGVFGPVGIIILLIASYLLWLLAHAIGEIVCALLTKLGFDPRPKQRYRRDYNDNIVPR